MIKKRVIFGTKIHNKSIEVLSSYPCFNDRNDLVIQLSVVGCGDFQNEMPSEKTPANLAEKCIILLLKKGKDKDDNWFIILFFKHLVGRYPGEDSNTELEKLRTDAEKELSKYDTVQESKQEGKQESKQVKKFMASTGEADSEEKQKSLEEEAAEWVTGWEDDAQDWAWHIGIAFFDGVYYSTMLEIRQKLTAALEARFMVVEEESKKPPEITKPKSKKKPDSEEEEEEEVVEAEVATSPKPRLKIADMQAALARVGGEDAEILINDEDEEDGVIEVIRLKNSKLSQYVIQLIWRKYPDLHNLLIDLLLEYALNHNMLIRNRVARVVGYLAKTNFASIECKILELWAELALTKDGPILSTVISRVFAILIVDEKRQTLAKGLLKEWINSNNQALRWAAMWAYIYVGLTFPGDAIESWRKIAEREPLFVIELSPDVDIILNPILQSLEEAILTFLYSLSHERDKAAETLQALSKWASTSGSTSNWGLIYFLISTQIEAETDEGTSDAEATFLLLCLVNSEGGINNYRTALAGLFCQALLDRDKEEDTLVALNTWVDSVDSSIKEKTLHKNRIKTVYLDILSSPSKETTRATVKRKLLYHLEIWANRRKSKNSETAQWLLGQLKGK